MGKFLFSPWLEGECRNFDCIWVLCFVDVLEGMFNVLIGVGFVIPFVLNVPVDSLLDAVGEEDVGLGEVFNLTLEGGFGGGEGLGLCLEFLGFRLEVGVG